MDSHHTGHKPPVYDFGWWPEIAGLAMTLGLIAFLIALASGEI